MRSSWSRLLVSISLSTLSVAVGCGGGDVTPDAAPPDVFIPPVDAPPLPVDANLCGNGALDPGEECDDGNASDGDGCQLSCIRTIAKLVAGRAHTCAMFADGRVKCWGAGDSGQLGYGNTRDVGDDETPGIVGFVALGDEARDIAAGGDHTCARLRNGHVQCWGPSPHTGLGTGATVGDDEAPSAAGEIDVGLVVGRIQAGPNHTCLVDQLGGVRCWGDGATSGALGYGNTEVIGDDESVSGIDAVQLGLPANNTAVGRAHTCILDSAGNARCWGTPAFGVLGNQDTTTVIGDDETPTSLPAVDLGGLSIQQLVAGNDHTCAMNGGFARCWGRNDRGQLGYGHTNAIGDDETPFLAGLINTGGIIEVIAAGGDHTCVAQDGGQVRCWGDNTAGQLGYGHTDTLGDDESPSQIGDVPVGGAVVGFALGDAHTCALLDSGRVKCWGQNNRGQLGYGHTTPIGDDETPDTAGNVPLF